MKKKLDIVVYKMNGKIREGFELSNVDVEDVNTLYRTLRPYGVKVGVKKEDEK